MRRSVLLSTAMFLTLLGPAPAQEGTWQHSGSLYVLTTPEGAHLPASASEEGFPLLVRLHKDFFDFSRARPKGEDIRKRGRSTLFNCLSVPLAFCHAWSASETVPAGIPAFG